MVNNSQSSTTASFDNRCVRIAIDSDFCPTATFVRIRFYSFFILMLSGEGVMILFFYDPTIELVNTVIFYQDFLHILCIIG